MKKFLSILGDALLILFISFSCYVAFNNYGTEYVSIAGYSLVEVQSGSMQNSNIYVGDTYLIKKTDDYAEGDIIAFRDGTNFIFHEIIEVVKTETGDIDYYKTKGSSNELWDRIQVKQNAILGERISDINFSVVTSSGFRVSLLAFIYLLMMKYIAKAIKEIFKKAPNTETEKQGSQEAVAKPTMKPKIKKPKLVKIKKSKTEKTDEKK